MTEGEWLQCKNPLWLLDTLAGFQGERTLRLLACQLCRHPAIWSLLECCHGTRLVVLAEQDADGDGYREEMVRLAHAIPRGKTTGQSHRPIRLSPTRQAQEASRCLAEPDAWDAAFGVAKAATNLLDTSGCVRIRDIFGNPFQPLTLPCAQQTPAVVARARAAYDERHLPSGELDTHRLAVLADALEEAGCVEGRILEHLRGPGPHARGCHVVDLCLGLS